ncbi:MAG: lysostaphin resistance A-like protein [Candidatus Binataceae bacterium]
MIQGLTLKSGWVWLAFIAAVVHPIFVSLIGALPFISPLFRSDDHTHFINFWATMVVSAWTVTLIIVVCLRLSGVGLLAIGLWPPRPRVLLLLLLVALAIGGAIHLTPVHTSAMKQPSLPTLAWTHSERYFMLLVVAPTAAICEETIYRGLILRFLATPIGLWPAMIVQALLFAYMHGGVNQPPFLFVNGSILGFLLALLVDWRGNLRAAMAIHFVIDAIQLTLLLV